MMIDTAKLTSQAFGRWSGILVSAGIDSKHLVDRHGPCPMCGGKDRFRFDDGGNGRWFCSKCGSGDGFKLIQLKNGLTFPKAKEFVASIVSSCEAVPVKVSDDESKLKAAEKIWTRSMRIQDGDPAWIYLRRRCGDIKIPPILKIHPNLKHMDGGHYPAIVALMKDGKGDSTGIHRIYLTKSGEKAPVERQKAALGSMGSIRLSAVPSGILGIAEGIETALCASVRFGVPVWSAVCANGMEHWEAPEGVQEVHIFGDCDESFTGQSASYNLAKRLKSKGFQVKVFIPEEMGMDWADYTSHQKPLVNQDVVLTSALASIHPRSEGQHD